jgi:hypothetical protein
VRGAQPQHGVTNDGRSSLFKQLSRPLDSTARDNLLSQTNHSRQLSLRQMIRDDFLSDEANLLSKANPCEHVRYVGSELSPCGLAERHEKERERGENRAQALDFLAPFSPAGGPDAFFLGLGSSSSSCPVARYVNHPILIGHKSSSMSYPVTRKHHTSNDCWPLISTSCPSSTINAIQRIERRCGVAPCETNAADGRRHVQPYCGKLQSRRNVET